MSSPPTPSHDTSARVSYLVLTSRDFYYDLTILKDTLGFPLVDEDSMSATFDLGGVSLVLEPCDEETQHLAGQIRLGIAQPNLNERVAALRESEVILPIVGAPVSPTQALTILQLRGGGTFELLGPHFDEDH